MAHAERGGEVPGRRSVLQHRCLLHGWRSYREAADREKERERGDFHWDRRLSGEGRGR